ncbi:MAG: hypothetical protein M1840_005791 [Geoglossum simile]|nr:MAG: hypothetical protein M1840_005791 [Geoglossum simile]
MSSEQESLTNGLIEELNSIEGLGAFRSAINALKNTLKQASKQEPDQTPAYYKKAISTLSVEEVKDLLGVDYDENNLGYILTVKGGEVKDAQLSSWCSEWLAFRPFSF